MSLRDELARALALENETERKLAVVSLIGAQAQRMGWRAIVIGGLAVEFWTHGAYSTSDIDLYLPHGPAVDELFAELGFDPHSPRWRPSAEPAGGADGSPRVARSWNEDGLT